VALDPAIDLARRATADPLQRLADRLRDLEGRVDRIEAGRARPTFAGTGPPTIAAPDGALYVDTVAAKLYGRAGGVWKSTTLT
jgi:hypothetical protein